MSNAAIEIPFYVSRDGVGLTGAAGSIVFSLLRTIAGADKISSAPGILEIGGGWYRFSVSFGQEPFDEGDLVGVIDADTDGTNSLADGERYIPVEVRLDFYALGRLIMPMSQSKVTGDMQIKNAADQVILNLGMTQDDTQLVRTPS